MQTFIYRWQSYGFCTQIQAPYVSPLFSPVTSRLELQSLQCMCVLHLRFELQAALGDNSLVKRSFLRQIWQISCSFIDTVEGFYCSFSFFICVFVFCTKDIIIEMPNTIVFCKIVILHYILAKIALPSPIFKGKCLHIVDGTICFLKTQHS